MEIAPGVEIVNTTFWGRPLTMTLFCGDHIALVDTGMPGMPASCVAPVLNARGFTLQDVSQIIITHAHLDHFAGNEDMLAATNGKVSFAVHRFDQPWIEDPASHTKRAYGYHVDLGLMSAADLESFIKASGNGVTVDRPLVGGETFDLGKGLELQTVFTPGHSFGNMCVLDRKNRILVHGETIVGVAQFDAEGKLLTVPYYYDVEAYLGTVATVAQLDFDTLVSAHLPVMDREASTRFLEESLDFCVSFEQEVRRRLKESTPGSRLIEIWLSMDNMWGQYPADLGMYWLLETHVGGLIKQGLVEGEPTTGLTWIGPDRDHLAPLAQQARAAIKARRG